MDEVLKIVLQNKFKGENWVKKNYPDFHFFITDRYKHLNIVWKAKIFLFQNSLDDVPRCYCGNELKYTSNGFRIYCSVKCLSSSNTVKTKIKKTNNEKYGGNSPMCSKDVQTKSKKTSLINWGVDNPSKSNVVKEKVKNTNNKNYGVDYISQRDDIKMSLSKIMKSNLDILKLSKQLSIIDSLNKKIFNYNISFSRIKETSLYEFKCHDCDRLFDIHKNTLNDRINNRNIICTNCNKISNYSDYENQVYDYVKKIYNGKIIRNSREIIGKELDIYLPDLKLAFEFNGLYWHSDVYKDKYYHKNKTDKCISNNIKLIHIWEDDWLFKNDIVKSRICNILGCSKKIWARNCDIREVSRSESNTFIKENHLQGIIGSKIRIGLFYKNELVSLMTFGDLRISLGHKSKKDNYEMLRFCNKKYLSVIGGASKLFKYFLEKYVPIKVISYADRSWSDGSLYRRLGFRMVGYTNPNFFYVVNNVRKNRFTYRKNRLVEMGFDSSKSADQIIKESFGYLKIYDSGSIKFEFI